MDLANLYALSAVDAARLIREGVISSEQFVGACLARVDDVDKEVQAWAFLDREYVLEQARAADRWRGEGNPLGALHGVPVGIKDIIDTGDMPTENGSVLHAGRHRRRGAARRSARRMRGVVRIARLARCAAGELRRHRLAHDHRTGAAQPRDHARIPRRRASGMQH